MKVKRVVTLGSCLLILMVLGLTATEAQGPPPVTPVQPTTIDDIPAVYNPVDMLHALDLQAATLEQQVIALFNIERGRSGLPPLVHNRYLTIAAQGQVQYLATCGCPFSHTGAGGSSPWDRIPRAGYTGSLGGEVLAGGQIDAASVAQAWIQSPDHHAIMLGAYGEIGVGYVNQPGSVFTHYWAADLGGSPGRTTPGADSNPGPVLTATPVPIPATSTPISFLKTPTPTVPFYLPTATPIPQPGVGGWQIILWCDTGGVNCRVVAQGPR